MHSGAPGESPEERGDGSPEGRGSPREWVRTSSLGLQVVITFGVLAWAGIWIDGHFKTAPWGVLGGVALGLFSMFTTLLREGGMLKSVADRERAAKTRESVDERDDQKEEES